MLRESQTTPAYDGIDDTMISFETTHQNNVVGIVDVVNSTGIISKLTQQQACKYYSVFHNVLGYIIKNHGATVVKNIGDGILFHFPRACPLSAVLPCSHAIINASGLINNILQKHKIPPIRYRISLDYGPLMIAKYNTSSCKDIFGPTVNMCSKINHTASPNQIVIGSDLFEVVKRTKGYVFRQAAQFHSAIKQNYPVYAVGFVKYMKNV